LFKVEHLFEISFVCEAAKQGAVLPASIRLCVQWKRRIMDTSPTRYFAH